MFERNLYQRGSQKCFAPIDADQFAHFFRAPAFKREHSGLLKGHNARIVAHSELIRYEKSRLFLANAMKFIKQVFFVIGVAASFTLMASGQQKTDPDPDHKPDVFLDNHRPAIQKKGKPPTTRTVSGHVVDDTGQPLEGALVNLTDTKTKEHRTFFTKKDGRYTFEDLSFSVDYHIQAKWKTLISDERNLSQYDHAASLIRILQVATPEGPASAVSANAGKETPKPKQ